MFRLKNALQRAIKPNNTTAPRRMMSGGPSAPPTGLEATVRGVLPEDHQIVMATLGGWVTLIFLGKLAFSGGKKEEAEAAAASSASSSDKIPSLFDDAFDEWSKVAGNMAKWEASLDKIE